MSCASKLELPITEYSSSEVERISIASASRLSVGDDQTQVIKVLGTPNIITKNKIGNESWVYDKVSNQYEFVQNNNSREFFFQKPDQRSKGASTSKTFIVVIDFNDKSLIKDISYRFTQY
ncbi:outer membrane protein assembly factor BamE [Gammaproteobacteria bacterium]|nr:outer membrane protein assembly factor BamE [Gammaproteobacteria bacterium]MDA9869488.1 outer membrane protein assembly factor BamE [Gammaproteobacteria bacterium]MDC3398301.1 outer membrane protein assembly factor BamE [Gammaproteobacteria bacterium]